MNTDKYSPPDAPGENGIPAEGRIGVICAIGGFSLNVKFSCKSGSV